MVRPASLSCPIEERRWFLMRLRMAKLLSPSHDPMDGLDVRVHTIDTCDQGFTRHHLHSLCAWCQLPGNEPFNGSIMQILDLNERCCKVGSGSYRKKKKVCSAAQGRGGVQTARTPLYVRHWCTIWRSVGRGGVSNCKDYGEKKAWRERLHTGGGATSPWLTSLTKTH